MKAGDRVKLKKSIKNHTRPEGREDNKTAIIWHTYGEDGKCCHMKEDLEGCAYWNMDDLEIVK